MTAAPPCNRSWRASPCGPAPSSLSRLSADATCGQLKGQSGLAHAARPRQQGQCARTVASHR